MSGRKAKRIYGSVRHQTYRSTLKDHGVFILNFSHQAQGKDLTSAREIVHGPRTPFAFSDRDKVEFGNALAEAMDDNRETALNKMTTYCEDLLQHHQKPQLSLAYDEAENFQEELDRIVDHPKDLAIITLNKYFSRGEKESERLKDGVKVFDGSAMPHSPGMVKALARPKCDRTFGYSREAFSLPMRKVLDCPGFTPYVFPSKENYFPFFAVEFKAPSRAGTLWVAENQCAGFGAHCLSSIMHLLKMREGPEEGRRMTKIPQDPKMTEHQNEEQTTEATKEKKDMDDVFVFSCTMDYRAAVFWVHWCESAAMPIYKSTPIRVLDMRKIKHIQDLHFTIQNIMTWGLGDRLTWIKKLCEDLQPVAASYLAPRVSRSNSRRNGSSKRSASKIS